MIFFHRIWTAITRRPKTLIFKKRFHVEKNNKIEKRKQHKASKGLFVTGKRQKKTQQSKLNAGDTDSLNLKEHGASGGW